MNIAKKKQIFYDPSGACGKDMLQFMSEHHLQEPDAEPARDLIVVDREVPWWKSLQVRYFGSGTGWNRCVPPTHYVQSRCRGVYNGVVGGGLPLPAVANHGRTTGCERDAFLVSEEEHLPPGQNVHQSPALARIPHSE
jgi:hypothetical protein